MKTIEMTFSAGAVLASLLVPIPGGAQEVTEITFLGCGCWGGDVPQVIQEFEAANPDIRVTFESPPTDQLFQQIQVRMGAGDAGPDVIAVDGPLTTSYAARGWLSPLDEVFTDAEKGDWLPSSLEAASYDGQLVTAPLSTSTQILYYNKAAFDAAGVTPPGPDERWTWEQVADAATKLTVDENQDGAPEVWGFIWEQVNRIYQLEPLPLSLGGKAIGEDGLTVQGVINSDEWVRAFTYYSSIFNELKVGQQGAIFWPPDLFEQGQIAMFVGGPWDIPRFAQADLPFEWGVSRHPYFEGGEIVTPTGGWHVGVSAFSDNREAAERFVHWLAAAEGAEAWWHEGPGDFPARQSLLAQIETDPAYESGPMSNLRIAASEAETNPVPRPLTVGYLEYEQILADTFQNIRNGTDVKEALDNAALRIESEMGKYR